MIGLAVVHASHVSTLGSILILPALVIMLMLLTLPVLLVARPETLEES